MEKNVEPRAKMSCRTLLREMKNPRESLLRIGAENASWRLTVMFCITPAMIYLTTHKLRFAFEFGIAELAVKYPLQMLHSRLWSHLPFGYKKQVILSDAADADAVQKQNASHQAEKAKAAD